MILSDQTIRELLSKKELIVEPIDDLQIQPASIDLRLGNKFLTCMQRGQRVVSFNSELVYSEEVADKVVIPAHGFILATTKEKVGLPNNLTAFVEGRSSVGRAGLFIQNAGWVDPGFKGRITLELFNANSFPIEIEAGMRICQIILAQTDQAPSRPYQGKYLNQDDVTGSRIHMDSDR